MLLNEMTKRLNYNVPKELVPMIRVIAQKHGITPAYWLRKTLEKAVQEYHEQDHAR